MTDEETQDQPKVKQTRYTRRKARMAADPEFRKAILRTQAASRRKRVEAQHAEAVAAGRACPHVFPGGRHCWKSYAHTHAGKAALRVVASVRVDPF